MPRASPPASPGSTGPPSRTTSCSPRCARASAATSGPKRSPDDCWLTAPPGCPAPAGAASRSCASRSATGPPTMTTWSGASMRCARRRLYSMAGPEAELRFADELRIFLAPRHRDGRAVVTCDGTSTLGHVIESLGVPLPEVGDLRIDGEPVTAASRPAGGQVAEVAAVRRPQPLPDARFVLDVHLGTLARRLRLTGVDAAYANDRDDDDLIAQANAEERVLLTQDRGLLRRRKLWMGAYVRGADPRS